MKGLFTLKAPRPIVSGQDYIMEGEVNAHEACG